MPLCLCASSLHKISINYKNQCELAVRRLFLNLRKPDRKVKILGKREKISDYVRGRELASVFVMVCGKNLPLSPVYLFLAAGFQPRLLRDACASIVSALQPTNGFPRNSMFVTESGIITSVRALQFKNALL